MKANRKAIALLSTGHAITDINQGALPIVLVFLQPVLGLSPLQIGVVMLVFTTCSSVIQPVFGVISDRVRASWLIPLGCFLAGLGLALTGFFQSYQLLLVAALVSGLGLAAFHPEGSKFTRLVSGAQKASGMSLFAVGGNLGFAAGPVLAGIFYSLAGLKGTGGFLLINGVAALLLWRYLAYFNSLVSGGRHPMAPGGGSAVPGGTGLGPLKSMVPLAVLLLVVFMRAWVHLGLVTFLPLYCVQNLHYSETYAASLASLYLFAGAVGTVVGGPAADRWGLKSVIVGSLALLLPFIYLTSVLTGFGLTVAVALAGFLVISTFGVTVVFGQELLPNHVGLASGLMLGFAIGMGGVGATFFGWVGDHWGLAAALQSMVAVALLGALLALFLPGREEMARRQPA